MSLPANYRPFWRYLLRPHGESAILVVVFMLIFVIGLGSLSTFLSQLSDLYQHSTSECNSTTFVDMISIITRLVVTIICLIIDFFLYGEIYKNYNEELKS